jgi:MFS superfamily sulfate permease-like transporter
VRARLRGAVLALAPLVRLAPWLLPGGLAVMVAFVAVSVVVSFVGAVLTACGMAAVLHRVSRRLRARAARRRSLAP